jgi:exosortase
MTTTLRNPTRWKAMAATALGLLCIWVYWPTLGVLGSTWWRDAQYSHGYLVPVFAAVLLWLRRSRLAGVEFELSWVGLIFLGFGCVFRTLASYLYFDWLDGFSLVVTIAGLFGLFGGKRVLLWAWPALAFLLFMLPLPFRIETMLSHPLQKIATTCSVYAMQTLGLPAIAEGNVIHLTRGRIGVVEACNGLSMLLVFFAMATAIVLLIRRPMLDKIALLVGAIPIAVLANVVRITTTGLAQEWIDPTFAQRFFHDWAGWFMMPLALTMFLAELWFLDRLLIEKSEDKPLAPILGAFPAARSVPARQLSS